MHTQTQLKTALLRLVIGLETWRHFLHQSQIVTHASILALGVIATSFDLTINCSASFGIG